MHPQTLRIYEAKGLVRPRRTPGNTRLYSETDLERLREIQRLTTNLGLNLAGVERVLALQDEVRLLSRRLAALEREMRNEVERVHRQYRRDLVLYADPDPINDFRSRGHMDFRKLTIKSQEAVAAAGEDARRRGNPEVYPEHLVLALLDQELPRTLCERAGASPQALRAEAEAALASKPAISGAEQQPRVPPRSLACSMAPRRDAQARG